MGPPAATDNPAVEDRVATVRRALADAMARRSGFVDIAGISSRADLAAIFSAPPGPPTSPAPAMRGLAVWIADTPGRPQLLVSDGLPGVDHFIRMFSGGSGARSAGGAGAQAIAAEDPLATRPQGLGPPSFAAAAPAAGNDDLLSLFGRPAVAPPGSDAAPRELLPDDDILALFKVGGDSASGALEPPGEVIPEHDPLRMFEAGAPPALPQGPAPAVNDDILAMFSASEAPPNEFGADASPASDPLGMFEVPPETPPFGETQAAPPLPQETRGQPDILDMFGVTPEKPEGKEAK